MAVQKSQGSRLNRQSKMPFGGHGTIGKSMFCRSFQKVDMRYKLLCVCAQIASHCKHMEQTKKDDCGDDKSF